MSDGGATDGAPDGAADGAAADATSALAEAARDFFEAGPDPIIIFDAETLDILDVNPAAVESYGYSRDEFLSMTLPDIRMPDDMPELDRALREHKGGRWGPSRHRTRDGRVLDVEIRSHKLQFRGRPAWLAQARDVSAVVAFERRQTELREAAEAGRRTAEAANRALSARATQLRAAKRLLSIGFWSFDMDSAQLHWSDEVHDIYGQPPDRPAPDFEGYVALVHRDDRSRMRAEFDTFALSGRRVFNFEHRILRPDGRIVHVHGTAERATAEGRDWLSGVVQDITDLRQGEAARERSDTLLRLAGRTANFGGWFLDLASGRAEWSRETAQIHDTPDVRFIDAEDAIRFYTGSTSRKRVRRALERCAETGETIDVTAQIVTAKGRRRWVRAVGEPVRNEGGRIVALQGALQDITELHEARSERNRLTEKLTQTLEQMGDAFFTLDAGWRFVFLNSAAERLIGSTSADYLGRVIWQTCPELSGTEFETMYRRVAASGEPVSFDAFHDGMGKWLHVRAHPVQTGGLAVYFRDVTEQRRRTEQLRLLQTAVAQQSDILVITSPDADPFEGRRILYVNAAFERVTGYAPDEVIGGTPRILLGPESDPGEIARIRAALAAGQPVRGELINYRKDGTPFWKELQISPVRDDSGRLTHWIDVQRDITHRKAAQQALEQSEERFRLVTRATSDAIWDRDLAADRVWWSESVTTLTGHDRDRLAEGTESWFAHIHPDDRARVEASLAAFIEADGDHWEKAYRFLCADGREINVIDSAHATRGSDGRARRMVGAIEDVTEQVRLETRLHEAQRLEAIGRLTGGIAHDFNNLLAIITGNAEFLSERLAQVQDPELQRMATATLRAAERGAALTTRLLSFARRQVLAPRRLDLRAHLQSLREMLQRVLTAEVALEIRAPDDLWPCELDADQFDSAVLNLVMNARNAMPEGGLLTVEAANVTVDAAAAHRHEELRPGEYVAVSVTDTGHGIDPEILPQVFEPFFRAAPGNRGTGLGLSMVQGFVRQSEGHVDIRSHPGQGTTVSLCFPRAPAGPDAPQPQPPAAEQRGRGEHLLLVEDDPEVRENAERALIALGYRVSSAADGPEAAEILRRRDDINLLFTDVVMPGGMTGRDLAETARQRHPALRVLFTSAYTQNALTREGRLPADTHLLAKPYRRADLAIKLRAVLDAPSPAGAAMPDTGPGDG